MLKSRRFGSLFLILIVAGAMAVLLSLAPGTSQDTEAATTAVVVESIITSGDARIQGGSPDVNFSSGYLYLAP